MLWAVDEQFNPIKVAATLMVGAPVSPVAPPAAQIEALTSNAHITADGYRAMTELELSMEPVLPIVQTNTGWNTIIRATNVEFGLSMADIEVEIYPRGVGEQYYFKVENVPSGGTATFDLLALGVPEGSVGSAWLRRTDAGVPGASGDIVAIAERYKASTNMLIINVAQLATRCRTEHFVPLVFDNYNSWNTGISIANMSNMTNDVFISYYATNGTKIGTTQLQIPANGQNFVYTPSSGAGTGFVGAAVIEGTSPLCAVVDAGNHP